MRTRSTRRSVDSITSKRKPSSSMTSCLAQPAAPHPPVGRLHHFEAQAFVFDDLASFRNASGQFADQAGDGRGFAAFRAHTEEFIKPVYIHIAGDDVRMVNFLN